MKRFILILMLIMVLIGNGYGYSFEDDKHYTVIDKILPAYLQMNNMYNCGLEVGQNNHRIIDVASFVNRASGGDFEVHIDVYGVLVYIEPLFYKLQNYFGGTTDIGGMFTEDSTQMKQKFNIDTDGDGIYESMTYWEAFHKGIWRNGFNTTLDLKFVHYKPGLAKSMFPFTKAPIEDIFGPNPTRYQELEYEKDFSDWPYKVSCLFGPSDKPEEFTDYQWSGPLIYTNATFNFDALLDY